MQQTAPDLELVNLMNWQQRIRESAQVVYDITEKLLYAYPEENRDPRAVGLLDSAYGCSEAADRRLELCRSLLEMGAYPSYPPVRQFWSHLQQKSNEQRDRLDGHLRRVCLPDSGDINQRTKEGEAAIDGMWSIYGSRDVLFGYLNMNERRRILTDYDVRVYEGIIELSIDFVESVAGILRYSTQVAFPG